MRFAKRSLQSSALLAGFLWLPASHAATFLTFIDNQPGFLATIGTGTTITNEDFSSSVDLKPIGTAGNPDTWNGFTVESYGPNTGTAWSPSKYCQNLRSGTSLSGHSEGCVFWNPSAPAIPGIFAAVSSDNGISFKPTNSTVAAFSFDFVDWNDAYERSNLLVLASDGTSTKVSDPTNVFNAPPQKFGVTLSQADIAAGHFIKEIRWLGIDSTGEVIGFYNFQTYTNPKIQNTAPIANLDKYAIPISPTILNLLANDTDADSDALQIASINGTSINPGVPNNILITGGMLDISAVGVVTFTPSTNSSDPISFQYEISDGRGGTSSSMVTLTNKNSLSPTITSVPTIGKLGMVTLSSLILAFSLIIRRKINNN